MKDVRKRLNKLLTESATRYGSSAFRLGLVTNAVSDHLQIEVRTELAGRKLKLASWNLLADQHLYNNLMNVSGAKLLNAYITKEGVGAAYQNKMHHFFSELAQYLMKKVVDEEVVVTKAVLGKFVSLAAQSSLLARSRDPEVAEQRRQAVVKARRELMANFGDDSHPLAHEFKLAIRHSMELIYHIQNSEGVLSWKNRVKHLQENKKLCQRLSSSDVIALQECTDSEEVLAVLQEYNPNLRMIVHPVNERTSDHCVLIYDQSRLGLDSDVVATDFSRQKPCLYARFVDLDTQEKFVVGSIHHPGGEHDHIAEVQEVVRQLQVGVDTKSFVLGDFNHTAAQFSHHGNLVYPVRGTMASNDYGNNNQAIDCVLTSLERDQVVVKRMGAVRPALPAYMPVKIQFRREKVSAVVGSIFARCREPLVATLRCQIIAVAN